MIEIWKPIPGYEGRYEVSNMGRVWSLARITSRGVRGGVLCAPLDNGKGYLAVNLHHRGKTTKRYIHRLVFQAHCGPINQGLEVNHRDGNKSNNAAENLEVLTHSQNLRHAYDTGLHPGCSPRTEAVAAERNGEHVAHFPSILEAAQAAGVQPCTLCHALAGRTKVCGGFRWRYAR